MAITIRTALKGGAFRACPDLAEECALYLVITREARNLLLFKPGAIHRKRQIPHGLKAGSDDNSGRVTQTLHKQPFVPQGFSQ
jgi:hypothetical protein